MACVLYLSAGNNSLRRCGSETAVQIVQKVQGDEGYVRAVNQKNRRLYENHSNRYPWHTGCDGRGGDALRGVVSEDGAARVRCDGDPEEELCA